MGIERSLGWEPVLEDEGMLVFHDFINLLLKFIQCIYLFLLFSEDMEKIHAVTAPGIFIMSAMILLLIAKYRSMF